MLWVAEKEYKRWREEVESHPSLALYNAAMPHTGPMLYSFWCSDSAVRKLAGLRAAASPLMDDRARTGAARGNRGICPLCGVHRETTGHFLVHCAKLSGTRRNSFRVMKEWLREVKGGVECWNWVEDKKSIMELVTILVGGGGMDDWIGSNEGLSKWEKGDLYRIWYKGLSVFIESMWKERKRLIRG